MKKFFLFIAVAFVTLLAGCATSGNDAFIAAHKSANEARATEIAAKARADSDRSMAIASVAKGCPDASCRGMAMMALMQIGTAAGNAAQAAAPVIAAPVNEALEFVKAVVPAALTAGVQGYGIWANTALGVVNSNNALAARKNDNAMITTVSTTGTNAVAATAGSAFGVLGGVASEAMAAIPPAK